MKSDRNFEETIEKELEELKTVRFFDIYSDEKLITSTIKLGIRLEFQSLKGTLTNEIIEEKMNSLRNLLMKDFNVILQE
jgi:phenylalanyl-tRNA synthetase beta subunit